MYFFFDKATYLKFHNAGIPTVYYLPLAANVSRLSAMKCPDALLPQVSSDISFVGSLYNEGAQSFERLNGLSDYTKGYLDSIMLAQQNVYGYFFLEDLLTPPILEDLQYRMPVPAASGRHGIRDICICQLLPVQENYIQRAPVTAAPCLRPLSSQIVYTPSVLFSQRRSTSVPLIITTRCPTFFSTAAST